MRLTPEQLEHLTLVLFDTKTDEALAALVAEAFDTMPGDPRAALLGEPDAYRVRRVTAPGYTYDDTGHCIDGEGMYSAHRVESHIDAMRQGMEQEFNVAYATLADRHDANHFNYERATRVIRKLIDGTKPARIS